MERYLETGEKSDRTVNITNRLLNHSPLNNPIGSAYRSCFSDTMNSLNLHTPNVRGLSLRTIEGLFSFIMLFFKVVNGRPSRQTVEPKGQLDQPSRSG